MRLNVVALLALLVSSSTIAACSLEELLDPEKEEDEEGTPTPGNSPTPTPSPAPTPVTTVDGDVTTIDWGTVALDAGESPRFRFTAPAGTIGIDFMAIGGPADQDKIFGFFNVIGPAGREVIDNTGGGPARQAFAFAAMSFAVPSDDATVTRAEPGDWEFAIFAADDTDFVATDPQVLVKIRTAPGGTVPTGEIDLNVIVVEGLGFDATDACTPGHEVYDSIAAASDLYDSNLGLTISAATLACYDLTGAALTDIDTFAELDALFESSSQLADARANLYIVNSFGTDFGNAAGIAGSVPVPMQVNGTRRSGVAVQVSSVGAMTETIAHELGHSLGLYHTSEFDAATYGFDPISDSPECPGLGLSYPGDGSCPDDTNVMFPQLTGTMQGFSAGQGTVLAPTIHVRRQGVAAFAPSQGWVRPAPERLAWEGPPLRCVNGIVAPAY